MATKSKRRKKVRYVWVVAYIATKEVGKAIRQLSHYEQFEGIEAYIPTVKILQKTFKGKNFYEEVPLLFNYGFFKIPRSKARNPEFLKELREKISCIHAWVKDPANLMKLKPKLKPLVKKKSKELEEIITNDVGVALASDEEISKLIVAQKDFSIYSSRDLENIKEGSVITLHGYPFDDIPAKVVEINKKRKEVKVELLLGSTLKSATVSFDNVFYSIYKSDEALIGKSLDDIEESNPLIYNRIMTKIRRKYENE